MYIHPCSGDQPSVKFIIETHRGRMTHIMIITIIGSDNGLSPSRRQAINRTNAGLKSIGPIGTNFNEIWIKIQPFYYKKIILNVSYAKWRPFCLGLSLLNLTIGLSISISLMLNKFCLSLSLSIKDQLFKSVAGGSFIIRSKLESWPRNSLWIILGALDKKGCRGVTKLKRYVRKKLSIFQPYRTEFIWANIEFMFLFSMIPQHWDGACNWNPSL